MKQLKPHLRISRLHDRIWVISLRQPLDEQEAWEALKDYGYNPDNIGYIGPDEKVKSIWSGKAYAQAFYIKKL